MRDRERERERERSLRKRVRREHITGWKRERERGHAELSAHMMMHIATQHATLDPCGFAGLGFESSSRNRPLAARCGCLPAMAAGYTERWA